MSGAGALRARAVDLLALGRPLHLLGGALFYGLGVAAARSAGAPPRWPLAAAGLLAVLAAQLMAHYSNDYFDLEADRLNRTPTRWTGGSRVLVEDRLPPRAGLLAAITCAVLALVVAVIAAAISPAPALSLGVLLAAIGMAWAYSSPPLRLNWRGLGEVAGALLIPGMTCMVGFVLQAGAITPLPLLLAVPLCLFDFMQLLAANVPDAEGDTLAGKHTLVVRLGRRRAAWVYLAALAAGYAALPLLVAGGLPWRVALAGLGATPIAIWLAVEAARGWPDPARWDALGFWSVGLIVGTALCQLAALVWA
ncbi:prenyltransferase [Oscillochloris sp. ZM17-4]|uniref:prenyltransferase n=1 Tax=Oscillochloris sp. ZM17-4 TaxID=2866714 RepID=UPI001C72A898|nr:prenyltransferase [Oscillochloris sp. ZM17-4]MBX0328971.1 prenyltransferase [Oscillochloris sp. ZM17-4]